MFQLLSQFYFYLFSFTYLKCGFMTASCNRLQFYITLHTANLFLFNFNCMPFKILNAARWFQDVVESMICIKFLYNFTFKLHESVLSKKCWNKIYFIFVSARLNLEFLMAFSKQTQKRLQNLHSSMQYTQKKILTWK